MHFCLTYSQSQRFSLSAIPKFKSFSHLILAAFFLTTSRRDRYSLVPLSLSATNLRHFTIVGDERWSPALTRGSERALDGETELTGGGSDHLCRYETGASLQWRISVGTRKKVCLGRRAWVLTSTAACLLAFAFSNASSRANSSKVNQMEQLYGKLYDKYEKIKKKRMDEMDEINKEQEEKFLNCINVAEEVIQHLKGENGKLLAEINKLRYDMVSLRSSKDQECAEYQNLLLEEKMKYKVLSDKFENLQKLHQEALANNSRNNELQVNSPESGQPVAGISARVTRSMKRKHGRESGAETEDIEDCNQGIASIRKPEDSFTRKHRKQAVLETVALDNHALDVTMPGCCRRTDDINGGTSYACLFQALVECLVGMKITGISQAEGICIAVVHQSSGYSFNLSWMNKGAEDEAELVYKVSSLGTFERVAPEWMREVIIFSQSMCPTFFERVSRVIKSH